MTALPPNTGTISCHFALYVTTLPQANDIFAITFDAADPSLRDYVLAVALRQGSAYLSELGTFTNGQPINTFNGLPAGPPFNG